MVRFALYVTACSMEMCDAVGKRGLVSAFCNHAKLFGPKARNWMYNYGTNLTKTANWEDWETDSECRRLASSSDFEFVPMVFSLDKLNTVGQHPIQPDAQRLLGMNEPSSAKNESASESAKLWKKYEELASHFDPPLLLGTPAPGGLGLDSAMSYLRDFFAHCTKLHSNAGCRIDFVAVHFYECNGTTAETAERGAKDMIIFLDSVYEAFQKPIWLTEFNCGDGDPAHNPFANQTAANHLRFMKAALPMLEAAEHVERYSWFQTWQDKSGANPGCSLVNQAGDALTELGEFYDTYQFSGRGHETAHLV